MSLERVIPSENRCIELALIMEEAPPGSAADRLFHAGAEAAVSILECNGLMALLDQHARVELADAMSQYVITVIDTYLERRRAAREAMPETLAVDHRPPA